MAATLFLTSGGPNTGYEKLPRSIGIAWTDDPSTPKPGETLGKPLLRHDDPHATKFENDVLYKSYIFRDPRKTLGASLVMACNSRPAKGNECIGVAASEDMTNWRP